MKEKGIEYVHIVGVDNILSKLADPIFVGYLAHNKLSLASKYVTKRNAEEQVGCHIFNDGKPSIIEYSEMKDLAS